jgi:hypothetical protein
LAHEPDVHRSGRETRAEHQITRLAREGGKPRTAQTTMFEQDEE